LLQTINHSQRAKLARLKAIALDIDFSVHQFVWGGVKCGIRAGCRNEIAAGVSVEDFHETNLPATNFSGLSDKALQWAIQNSLEA
jgi:hypothetical protein